VKLTENDLRVLNAIDRACGEWDGYIPHGAADWTAIRRLEAEVLVECMNEYGTCQTCREPHEAMMFKLTVYGDCVLRPVSEALSDDARDAGGEMESK